MKSKYIPKCLEKVSVEKPLGNYPLDRLKGTTIANIVDQYLDNPEYYFFIYKRNNSGRATICIAHKKGISLFINEHRDLFRKTRLSVNPTLLCDQIHQTTFYKEKYPLEYRLIGMLFQDKRFC